MPSQTQGGKAAKVKGAVRQLMQQALTCDKNKELGGPLWTQISASWDPKDLGPVVRVLEEKADEWADSNPRLSGKCHEWAGRLTEARSMDSVGDALVRQEGNLQQTAGQLYVARHHANALVRALGSAGGHLNASITDNAHAQRELELRDAHEVMEDLEVLNYTPVQIRDKIRDGLESEAFTIPQEDGTKEEALQRLARYKSKSALANIHNRWKRGLPVMWCEADQMEAMPEKEAREKALQESLSNVARQKTLAAASGVKVPAVVKATAAKAKVDAKVECEVDSKAVH